MLDKLKEYVLINLYNNILQKAKENKKKEKKIIELIKNNNIIHEFLQIIWINNETIYNKWLNKFKNMNKILKKYVKNEVKYDKNKILINFLINIYNIILLKSKKGQKSNIKYLIEIIHIINKFIDSKKHLLKKNKYNEWNGKFVKLQTILNKIVLSKTHKIMWLEINNSCWYTINTNPNKSYVLFDYDDTLANRATSNIKPNVEKKLKELSKDNNICIFTNQKGISKGKTTHKEVQKLLEEFCDKINIPLSIFYSIKNDYYRKPYIGMYNLMITKLKPEKILYYCGDAGGRKGDFSYGDLYFANNCNLVYKTPEEIFDNDISYMNSGVRKYSGFESLYEDDKWENGLLKNKRDLLSIKRFNYKDVNYENNKNYNSDLKDLILMVGPPSSGKSTITKKLIEKSNYDVINEHNAPTKQKVISLIKKLQKTTQKGIVIDKTNPEKTTRDDIIKLIDKKMWNIIIIFLNIEKTDILHLVKYRLFHNGNNLSDVVIHKYYKNLKNPNKDEGIFIELKDSIYDTEKTFNHNLRFSYH